MFTHPVPAYIQTEQRFAALGITATHHTGKSGGFWLTVPQRGVYGETVSLSHGGDVPYHYSAEQADALVNQIEGA